MTDALHSGASWADVATGIPWQDGLDLHPCATCLRPFDICIFLHFVCLSFSIQNIPLDLVTQIDFRPLADFLQVNSTASVSFRLWKPSMCRLLWFTMMSTGG